MEISHEIRRPENLVGIRPLLWGPRPVSERLLRKKKGYAMDPVCIEYQKLSLLSHKFHLIYFAPLNLFRLDLVAKNMITFI